MSSPSSGPPLAARDLDASCTQNANTTRPRSRIRVPRTVGCPAPRFGRRKLVELRSALRHVAIVAHVDYGKTNLVVKMLSQSGALPAAQGAHERVLDSMDLEQEQGHHIHATHTSVGNGTNRAASFRARGGQ